MFVFVTVYDLGVMIGKNNLKKVIKGL